MREVLLLDSACLPTLNNTAIKKKTRFKTKGINEHYPLKSEENDGL
jgi:hypothetical protein